MEASGRASRALALAAFAIPLAIFLSRPSCFWNFDGVACAAALELGDPLFLFHSQHLIYAFLGFLFWKATAGFGLTRALPALQLFTSLCSAAALAGLYTLCVRLRVPRWIALLSTIFISTTAVVWMWSTEAQVYALGMIGLAWGSVALLTDSSPAKFRRAGAWHALAVLGHAMNALWAAPAVYWILSETRDDPRARRRALGFYVGWLAGLTVLAYAVVFFAVVWPRHHEGSAVLLWLKGSAGLAPGRAWRWRRPGWRAPWLWAATTLRFFWGSFWPYAGAKNSAGVLALTSASMVGVAILVGRAARGRSRAAIFAFLWIAVFALFLWTWEPATECYRLPEAIPIGLLIALGACGGSRRWAAPLLLGFLAAASWWINDTTRLRPMSRTRNNAVYSQIERLAAQTPRESVYLTGGGLPWIYLLYFTGRPALNVDTPSGRAFMDQLAGGKVHVPVYVQDTALADLHPAPVLRPSPVDDLPWLQLQ